MPVISALFVIVSASLPLEVRDGSWWTPARLPWRRCSERPEVQGVLRGGGRPSRPGYSRTSAEGSRRIKREWGALIQPIRTVHFVLVANLVNRLLLAGAAIQPVGAVEH